MRVAMIRAAGLIDHSGNTEMFHRQEVGGGDFIVKGDRQRPPTLRSFSFTVTFLPVTGQKLMNLRFWSCLGFVSAEIRQENCTRHTRRKGSFKIKAR